MCPLAFSFTIIHLFFIYAFLLEQSVSPLPCSFLLLALVVLPMLTRSMLFWFQHSNNTNSTASSCHVHSPSIPKPILSDKQGQLHLLLLNCKETGCSTHRVNYNALLESSEFNLGLKVLFQVQRAVFKPWLHRQNISINWSG